MPLWFRSRRASGLRMVYLGERQKTMTAPKPRSASEAAGYAGILQAEISSFRLHLAAEGKAAKTIRTYTEAVQWFAAAHLLRETGCAGWDEVSKLDIQRWIVRLLDRYSGAYASNQYRALQQFFKWLAAEDQLPDPMAGLQPPALTCRLVPVFTGEELTRLEQACTNTLPPAPRYRDHRGVPGDRHPAGRAVAASDV